MSTGAPARSRPDHLLAVPGLRGAAVACGLKPSGRPDLALLVADAPMTAAGVFTRNRLPAAPVVVSREALAARPAARAVVINAGNANAMTGRAGLETALAMVRRVEERCGGPVLVLSTGIIGVPLPRDRVLSGIDAAADALGRDAGDAMAEAILTTDTRRKTHAVRLTLPATGRVPALPVTVGGMAKGSGMIHPDMATMLAVVATDAPVTPAALDAMLRRRVERSFHEITVDGDTSTNDAVLLLAGRGDDLPPIGEDDPRLPALEDAVGEVMEALARAIVRDGEGASRVLELRVTGAGSESDARRIADAVARSSLVKTALAGGDPNWGRLLAAAANAGVPLDAERLSLTLGGIRVYEGRPLDVDQAAVDAAFRRDEVEAELSVGDGPAAARRLTTDLTKEYVRINSEYTT